MGVLQLAEVGSVYQFLLPPEEHQRGYYILDHCQRGYYILERRMLELNLVGIT
jgi:hypothetical protein